MGGDRRYLAQIPAPQAPTLNENPPLTQSSLPHIHLPPNLSRPHPTTNPEENSGARKSWE
ncbi:MAG: hypothetical protein HC799_07410 [Limnothrix sp. RL_2_0]|nr:hypothetical protein [Limnothrix sp. RL_2_0]